MVVLWYYHCNIVVTICSWHIESFKRQCQRGKVISNSRGDLTSFLLIDIKTFLGTSLFTAGKLLESLFLSLNSISQEYYSVFHNLALILRENFIFLSLYFHVE